MRGDGEKRLLRTYRSLTGTGVNPQAARQALSFGSFHPVAGRSRRLAVRSPLGGKVAK